MLVSPVRGGHVRERIRCEAEESRTIQSPASLSSAVSPVVAFSAFLEAWINKGRVNCMKFKAVLPLVRSKYVSYSMYMGDCITHSDRYHIKLDSWWITGLHPCFPGMIWKWIASSGILPSLSLQLRFPIDLSNHLSFLVLSQGSATTDGKPQSIYSCKSSLCNWSYHFILLQIQVY